MAGARVALMILALLKHETPYLATVLTSFTLKAWRVWFSIGDCLRITRITWRLVRAKIHLLNETFVHLYEGVMV